MTKAVINPVKGKKAPDIGHICIMVSSQQDMDILCDFMNIDKSHFSKFYMGNLYIKDNISIIGPFIGSPYATLLLETICVWGASKIIFMGWVGSIADHIKIGDIILPTGAFVDEGTSKNYLGSDIDLSIPSPVLTKKIMNSLKDQDILFHKGNIWTTDAIYRETPEKINYYQSKKALGVEMELSALFSVAKFRNIDIGALLVVSDELYSLKWKPGFKRQEFINSRKIINQVITTICKQL